MHPTNQSPVIILTDKESDVYSNIYVTGLEILKRLEVLTNIRNKEVFKETIAKITKETYDSLYPRISKN